MIDGTTLAAVPPIMSFRPLTAHLVGRYQLR